MGYNVESSCTLNSTSAFNLSRVYRDFQPANNSNVELNIWVASGFLPNSDPNLDSDFISFPIIQTNQTIDGLLTWAATSKNSMNYASIATQGSYSSFDNIQCLIDFVLTNFSVTVNVTRSTIEVVPLNTIPSEAFNDCESLLLSYCFPISDYGEVPKFRRLLIYLSSPVSPRQGDPIR